MFREGGWARLLKSLDEGLCRRATILETPNKATATIYEKSYVQSATIAQEIIPKDFLLAYILQEVTRVSAIADRNQRLIECERLAYQYRNFFSIDPDSTNRLASVINTHACTRLDNGCIRILAGEPAFYDRNVIRTLHNGPVLDSINFVKSVLELSQGGIDQGPIAEQLLFVAQKVS